MVSHSGDDAAFSGLAHGLESLSAVSTEHKASILPAYRQRRDCRSGQLQRLLSQYASIPVRYVLPLAKSRLQIVMKHLLTLSELRIYYPNAFVSVVYVDILTLNIHCISS